ncbi:MULTISPECIES: NAD-glutamate dehydrogenase [Pseudonocardia]|uniref:NAD-specific glutamate dehydrogenase n=2 Tax=Pseudonocardia TaxID=1847 RepID=A0A1Y2MNA4_PSEAH|nr:MULTISPECIES: NAD-glutamate dehydrogenase [Pseudonocardia]OSY36147.1 NAD-specific glutamate dehydrogenase [Pseudonocardia autotrophica]TDN76580.1 glutamate dehydrogenase [Pseudonocardia autotrophica]BBG00581.1 glutamate dehydrogenase [Pseudonocardia autotrophica]GEC26965.1 glutamate dehydrogenase [Pseudonocardia saturnea]
MSSGTTGDTGNRTDLGTGAGGEPRPGSSASADLVRFYARHTPEAESSDGAGLPGPAPVVDAHLALAAHREPGRAAVRVVPGGGGAATVDIVTDDMPYLVESVLAGVGRAGGTVRRVVHPILVVHRDATGTLNGVDTEADPDHPGDALAESWMHLDVASESGLDPDALRAELERTLSDVRQIVDDTAAMTLRARVLADDLTGAGTVTAPDPVGDVHPAEVADLLRWLVDDHFVFVGYRHYARRDGRLEPDTETGLGVLRPDDAGANLFLPEESGAADPAGLLLITRAGERSRVLQAVHPYYVGVRTRDTDGTVTGEHRFLGMLTVPARHESVLDIPVVARRVRGAIRRAGFPADSYSGQQMLEVVSVLPRAELFAASEQRLHDTGVGVLEASARRAVRLFVHPDPYRRFLTCLVYLPRDRYTTATRLRITEILRSRLGGTDATYTAQVGDAELALLHLIVTTDPSAEPAVPDLSQLQDEVAEATRTWDDLLVGALGDAGATARPLLAGVPESYKAGVDPRRAVEDLRRVIALGTGAGDADGFDLRLYRGADGDIRFALYLRDSPATLTRMLPLLQQLDIDVVDERPYEFTLPGGRGCWLYDFGVRAPEPSGAPAAPAVAVEDAGTRFEEAFAAAWRGDAESDRFSALVLRAGLHWREAAVLRAYSRYTRQVGGRFTLQYTANVLVAHPDVAQALITLFRARFDPARADPVEREAAHERALEHVTALIDQVSGLDADRILRGLLAVIEATLRTNWFRGRPFFSFKIDPAAVPDMPAPRPRYEIFVYSPGVEGVHLRFGPVARGGLRFSDRQQDYRTEILGLVKAQAVKNAVIVPVGAKGGFVVRTPAPSPEHVRECYTTFISGLLDVTDNLSTRPDGSTETLPPPDVVRHDGDDSYLVVAADKGTATFSDLANSIAASYGFWLGDAFASGGSVGYDHKAMGITARGAWESVKRHFAERGLDTQTEEFTVVGVGDMSGDVFGNGMLLSEHIRLVAAFDHRHVFVDPEPVAATSYAERRRLFELPRSSWEDYDRALISAGGGVWPRTAKSVPVGPEMRAALGLPDEVTRLSPPDLINAILLAPADLLWNGGIGTYVKASDESNADVGDKANDPIRVDGRDLRVHVVGEGGNLGLTQRGRIEFARAGGRINTDAIDNSAGVDCSDHEVNIKILLDRLVAEGTLDLTARNTLLESMTDEVADLVLADNVAQNSVLGVARAHAAAMVGVHGQMVADLVERTGLNRELEVLPSRAGFDGLVADGLGLTSPELATLLAHTKLDLTDRLLQTDLPDRPAFAPTLPAYFPEPLRERFDHAVRNHPLRREIIGTRLVNQMVDSAGISYAFRLGDELAAGPDDAMRAWAVTTRVFALPELWEMVRTADVPVSVADSVVLEFRRLLDRVSRWFLTNRPQPLAVGAEISRFAEAIAELREQLPDLLQGREIEAVRERAATLRESGVPEALVEPAALSLYAYGLLDVVELVELSDREKEPRPAAEVARLYYALSEHLGVDQALTAVSRLDRGDRWHALARLALRDDLYGSLRSITLDALRESPPGTGVTEAVAAWEQANASKLTRARTALEEIGVSASLDLATLSVISRQLRGLAR